MQPLNVPWRILASQDGLSWTHAEAKTFPVLGPGKDPTTFREGVRPVAADVPCHRKRENIGFHQKRSPLENGPTSVGRGESEQSVGLKCEGNRTTRRPSYPGRRIPATESLI
jgi:hypothetical protein